MLRSLLHASELITGSGVRAKDGRRIVESDLGVINDGAMVFKTKKRGGQEIPSEIIWVGKTSELPKKYEKAKSKNLKNRQAVIPALTDCHTHMVFGGDRSSEFARRCAGATYEEIARQGGGIVSTIQPTRDASEKELYQLAAARLEASASLGVRIFEIKSGYGLSRESEIKCMKVIRSLKNNYPQYKIQATYLGAHAFPPDKERDDYLRVVDETLREVVDQGLADACDVFVDRGYFTLEEGQAHLERAKKLGLLVKLHGDELVDTGSAKMAAEIGALSVDHLLKVSKEGIQSLSRSNTVAVLLPGTAFYLKEAYAPARDLIDAGACVAVSTDFNPGSSMIISLPVAMTLSALYMGMSRAEVFAAVTYNAVKALGFHEQCGTLEPGFEAHFTVLPFQKFEQVYYEFAWVPGNSKSKKGLF